MFSGKGYQKIIPQGKKCIKNRASPVDEIYFTLGRAPTIKKRAPGKAKERAPGQLKKRRLRSMHRMIRFHGGPWNRIASVFFIVRRRDLFYVGANPNDKKTCSGVGILGRAPGLFKKQGAFVRYISNNPITSGPPTT